jgi:hypothetical protein
MKRGMQGAHPLIEDALARAVKDSSEKDEKRHASGTPIDVIRACQGFQERYRKG